MSGLPDVHPRPGLPAAVTVYEVGPRDGLQAEATMVPVAVKLELIDRLGDAGLSVIEATSFVAPSWVPQLADAEEVMAGLQRPSRRPLPGAHSQPPRLRPGRGRRSGRGGRLRVGHRDLRAAEPNATLDGAIAMAEPVIDAARNAGLRSRLRVHGLR